ncbi:MAG: hypothetical protein HKP56_04035, partial [Anderseniella sp.]|nr:hypothetical protein [Anderseniella sp.]
VRDFNALPRWHPRIADSQIENGEPSDKVEGIVAASVKPMEKIQDIRIMQLDGMGSGGSSGGGDGGGKGTPTDEVINSALRYRVQAPMVDSLLSDIGIDGSNLSKQGGLIREASDMQRIAKEARRGSGDGKPDDSSSSEGSGKSAGDDDTKAKK